MNCLSTFDLNSYKVVVIFAIIKPLHPKLAHAFGYRLSLSASGHFQTWPMIVTVTIRALLNSSLPVSRSTADENSNHNHLIIEENNFTVQLTFSDGNCSSSIYLLAGPDLPIGYIGLSLGPQDSRGPPANCGTYRVNYRHMISWTIIRQNFIP